MNCSTWRAPLIVSFCVADLRGESGFENNWVTTAGKNFFLIFRLYGLEKAVFDKTWKLAEVDKVQ
jgi:hypothetical protein